MQAYAEHGQSPVYFTVAFAVTSSPAMERCAVAPLITMHSRSNIGLCASLLLCGERIKVDEPGIVSMGWRLELSTAMNLH